MKKRNRGLGKIFLCILISLLMLSGCGRASESFNQSQDTGSADRFGEGGGETNGGAADSAVITVFSEERTENRYAEDGTELLYGNFQTVRISGEGYEKAAEAVAVWSARQEEIFCETVEEYASYAQDAAEESPAFWRYSIVVGCQRTRADGSVISLRSTESEYTGGAHGNYGSQGVTFDSVTGEKLSFWDLTDDPDAFAEETLAYCLQEAAAVYGEGLFAGYEETIRDVWEEEPNWFLDAVGITVIFNPYQIGPYAMGEAYISLPYKEFSHLLKEEYQMGRTPGVSVLEVESAARLMLDGESDSRRSVRIFSESPLDAGIREFVLEVDGKHETVAEAARVKSIYVIRQENGSTFLLFDTDMASDDYMTYVYEITDGIIRKADEVKPDTVIDGSTVNVHTVRLGVRVDALGTYTAYAEHELDAEGRLNRMEERYFIDTNLPQTILTTIRELPVVVEGTDMMLPAGSRIRVTGTDNHGFMYYLPVEGTGGEGEIHYTRQEDSWSVFIDGVDENEYFEMLPYAG